MSTGWLLGRLSRRPNGAPRTAPQPPGNLPLPAPARRPARVLPSQTPRRRVFRLFWLL